MKNQFPIKSLLIIGCISLLCSCALVKPPDFSQHKYLNGSRHVKFYQAHSMAHKNGITGYTSPNQLSDIEPMAMAGPPHLAPNITLPPDTLDQEKEYCDLLLWKGDKSSKFIKVIGETPTHIAYEKCVNGKGNGVSYRVKKSDVLIAPSYKKGDSLTLNVNIEDYNGCDALALCNGEVKSVKVVKETDSHYLYKSCKDGKFMKGPRGIYNISKYSSTAIYANGPTRNNLQSGTLQLSKYKAFKLQFANGQTASHNYSPPEGQVMDNFNIDQYGGCDVVLFENGEVLPIKVIKDTDAHYIYQSCKDGTVKELEVQGSTPQIKVPILPQKMSTGKKTSLTIAFTLLGILTGVIIGLLILLWGWLI